MAASTRAFTPTHTGPFSTPSGNANAPRSISPKTQSTHPAFAGDDTSANLKKHLPHGRSASPPSKILRRSPAPLTGAAALADQRESRARQLARESMLVEERHKQSVNPATRVKDALGGPEPGMSRPRDAPAAATEVSTPLASLAKQIDIPESNAKNDNMQTSPVSMNSFGSIDNATAPTATATEPATAGPLAINNVPGQEHAPPHNQPPDAPANGSEEVPGHRSFTFPGQLQPDSDLRGPSRGMSLPMSGFAQNSPRSPSTKRHKCPYCSTDFTRHHNLKSHLLTHSQEKPYECQDCHARFRRLHDLKRHTKLHTGERPHVCPKCGRRFARGDALARHNKGQGGCAGRRSSFGVDDDMEDGKGDEAMDGVEYQHDGDDAADRRVSEPGRRTTGARTASMGGSYHQHSSTYPPVAAASQSVGRSIQPYFPGNPSGGSNITSGHYAAGNAAGVFAHGGMTESPKPLSPGQPEHNRVEGNSLQGGRSPSMNQHMHPQAYARGAGRGTSPIGLPPMPSNPNAPQLPPPAGLGPSNPRFTLSTRNIANQTGTAAGQPVGPSMLHQQQLPGSNPGSHSSQSGGSMRDMMGNDIWAYIRNIEARNHQQAETQEARIMSLEHEVKSLKAQLVQAQSNHPQPPPQQAPQPPMTLGSNAHENSHPHIG